MLLAEAAHHGEPPSPNENLAVRDEHLASYADSKIRRHRVALPTHRRSPSALVVDGSLASSSTTCALRRRHHPRPERTRGHTPWWCWPSRDGLHGNTSRKNDINGLIYSGGPEALILKPSGRLGDGVRDGFRFPA